jgi:hypothetical protein
MRFLLPTLLVALLTVAAPAQAATKCSSTDLRYPFQKGGPKDFGVFRLTIKGGSCTTAHRVAKTWQTRFEKVLRDPDAKLVLPKKVKGYTFKTLKPNAAQTYRLRGVKGSSTIRFDYVVPNG